MEIFNADRKIDVERNNLLQRIKYEASKQGVDTYVIFPLFAIDGNKVEYKQSLTTQGLFKYLKKRGAIELIEPSNAGTNKMIKEARDSKDEILIGVCYSVKPIEPEFSRLCKEYEKRIGSQHPSTNESLKEKGDLELMSNGDLCLDNKPFANIMPHTPEYFFLQALYVHLNQPVSHDNIYNFCKDNLDKKKYSYTPQEFCNNMKNSIKIKLQKIKLDANTIIKATRTQEGKNAYMLTNPREF